MYCVYLLLTGREIEYSVQRIVLARRYVLYGYGARTWGILQRRTTCYPAATFTGLCFTGIRYKRLLNFLY